jgi:hypothetical protein
MLYVLKAEFAPRASKWPQRAPDFRFQAPRLTMLRGAGRLAATAAAPHPYTHLTEAAS